MSHDEPNHQTRTQNIEKIQKIFSDLHSIKHERLDNQSTQKDFFITLSTIKICAPELSSSQKQELIQSLVKYLKPPNRQYFPFSYPDTTSNKSGESNCSKLEIQVFQTLNFLVASSLDADESLDVDEFLDIGTLQQLIESVSYYLYSEFPWVHKDVVPYARDISDLFPPTKHNEFAEYLISQRLEPILIPWVKDHRVSEKTGRLIKKKRSIFEDSQAFENDNIFLLPTFQYCLENSTYAQIESHWPFLARTILNLIDDTTSEIKGIGCELLYLMSLKIPYDHNNIFIRSGLLPVFVEAAMNCLYYFTSDMSSFLPSRAIKALIEMANRHSKKERVLLLDEVLRKGVFDIAARSSYLSSDHGDFVLTNCSKIVSALGIHTARHLQYLVHFFVGNLTNPDAPSDSDFLQHHCELMVEIIHVCRERIVVYKYDILRALAECWVNTSTFRLKNHEAVRKPLRQVFLGLHRASEQTGGKKELDEDVGKLVENNHELEPLFEKVFEVSSIERLED